ncbi:HAMP domain-containing sensor histidine kinase [Leisingera sp. MMG026]|uniref:HAMP domain-containing sensor histidine kinase n=1 Tax=Leisingera sp. MMG026 TaxID=2909982 RepID=UPI001F4420F0|nr:HAMP domain-containing sensor histidine kinase [Leisingera sp. MMG026]MCF6433516.1 HAMP domain-containing histidine kinase [Leisingera sp. MMG026]
MWRPLRLTLGQQLMLSTIALVLSGQIVNVAVSRIADVQRSKAVFEGRTLNNAARVFATVIELPTEQRAIFAGALGNMGTVMEYGKLRPLFDSVVRRPGAEAEALTWLQEAGLPAQAVIMTKRAYPSPPPPHGPAREQSPLLRLGEPPRTLAAMDPGKPRGMPGWVRRERPAPPDTLFNLFHINPPAEVVRVSVQHVETGNWLSVYTLSRLSPVNAYYTKLMISTVVSLCLAAIFLGIGRRVMRPLRRLSREAERLGRGEAALILAVEGPRDTREIIGSFNRMNERVTQSVDYQIGLLRSLAHDLRGPLAGVKRLVASVGPDATRDQIETHLDRVEGVVDSIMAFSRAVMRDGDFQKVNLGQLLEVVIEDRVDQGYDATMADYSDVLVTCRVNAIQRCLGNLVENACKYGGEAYAHVYQDGTDAVVTIDDSGPGIPEDQLDRVFEPFQRLEEDATGSGLGLAIVKTIVTDQGGTIRLFNRPEGGLRAELRLPLEREE